METACPSEAPADIPKIEKAKMDELQAKIDKVSPTLPGIAAVIPQSREAEEKMTARETSPIPHHSPIIC